MVAVQNGRLAIHAVASLLLVTTPTSHSLTEDGSAALSLQEKLFNALPAHIVNKFTFLKPEDKTDLANMVEAMRMSGPIQRSRPPPSGVSGATVPGRAQDGGQAQEDSAKNELRNNAPYPHGGKHSATLSLLWEKGNTRYFVQNPSESLIQEPIVFFNRIPKTGSTSLVQELLQLSKKSRGQFLFEYHPYKIDLGDHKDVYTDKGLKDGHTGVCSWLARLARRPYPAVWAFHTPWFDAQHVCPEEWEVPVQETDLAQHASHNRAMKYRNVNTAGNGLQVWSDEIVWINQLRHPADKWISATAYTQSCICRFRRLDAKEQATTWCADIYGKYTEYLAWYCTLSVQQLTESALGYTATLPPNGPPQHEGYPGTRKPMDCQYADWLAGEGTETCALLSQHNRGGRSYNMTLESVSSAITKKFKWIGILEEPQASIRVLRNAIPSYFKAVQGGEKIVHAGDASQRKDGSIPAVLKEKLVAALPVDMAIYNMAKKNLLKENAVYKAQAEASGTKELPLFAAVASTDIGTDRDVNREWRVKLKINRGVARGHFRGLFETWFEGDQALVEERLNLVSKLLDDINDGVDGDRGYLLERKVGGKAKSWGADPL